MQCITLSNLLMVVGNHKPQDGYINQSPYKGSAWWFVGNHKPQSGYLNQSLRFEHAMKVQNVYVICLLVFPLTCGMCETDLKPFYFIINRCYDLATLLLVLHHILSWCVGKTGTGQIMLWQVNYHFSQTLWQVIIHTLFWAL